MAKEKKKMNLFVKILLWILGILTGLIALLALANTICTAIDMRTVNALEPVYMEDQLTPEIDDATGFYTFTTDREFKVMQLSDIHLGSAILTVDNDKQVIKTVETMIRAEKPDLVIVTGDAFFPVPQSGTFNNGNELKVFSTMMNKLGVYWAFAFGNHEYQGFAYLDEAALAERLEEAEETRTSAEDRKDLIGVLQGLVPYFIAIGSALIAAIVISVAVKKLPKAKKKFIRGETWLAALLAIILIVNLI